MDHGSEPLFMNENYINAGSHLRVLNSLDFGKQRQAEIRRGVEVAADEGLVRERLKALRDFPWSSYRTYAGYRSEPKELQTPMCWAVLKGRAQPQRRKKFREYTKIAIREGVESERLLDLVRYGVLLGSEEWTEKLRLLLEGDEREQPALHAAAKQEVSFDAVAAAVSEEFDERGRRSRTDGDTRQDRLPSSCADATLQ